MSDGHFTRDIAFCIGTSHRRAPDTDGFCVYCRPAKPPASADEAQKAAFMAGRFGRQLPSGWTFDAPEFAHNAEEAYAAWLAKQPKP